MKKIFLYLLSFILLTSCSEDISQDIQTDMLQEADQFFTLSEIVNESSYLGNFSFGDYFRITSASLPGCPTLSLNSQTLEITLDYSKVETCDQQNTVARSGKIILDFSQANSNNPTWTMKYEGYTFQKTKIDGIRYFKRLSTSQNSESFENLKITTENNLGFTIKGTYTYFLSRFNFRPFGISYVGRHEGINPAGRSFVQSITEAKELFINCYSEGFTLPQKGKENWKVSRGSTDLNYTVNYTSTQECVIQVKAVLPDGRTIDLQP
ncbi:hypothetical protein [Algoriphagus mannitolivorans]|uniref:hypothetical protein n=1 Tax=Algoriphagus mannitolivorans TaxID=226504 RepID=UPI0004017441|nr:hypothetical protein [Algoriphagus mannitolivorans]